MYIHLYIYFHILIYSCIHQIPQVQVLPEPDSVEDTIFFWVDAAITVCFTFDLCANLAAHSENYFRAFYTKLANWFDLLIVIVSIAMVYVDASGGNPMPLKMLRLIRVLKVMRQVTHLRNFNRLVTSIGFCLKPMASAFLILFVVQLIYSVLGVYLFADQVPVYFADLKTALLTLNQMVTGDSWSSGVTRSIFTENPETGIVETNAAVALFFISYMIIGNVLLLNVVVAVLVVYVYAYVYVCISILIYMYIYMYICIHM